MLYKSMLQYTRVHFSARVVVAVQISNLGKNVMVQTVHMYRRKITGSKHHQIIHQLLLEFLIKYTPEYYI